MPACSNSISIQTTGMLYNEGAILITAGSLWKKPMIPSVMRSSRFITLEVVKNDMRRPIGNQEVDFDLSATVLESVTEGPANDDGLRGLFFLGGAFWSLGGCLSLFVRNDTVKEFVL